MGSYALLKRPLVGLIRLDVTMETGKGRKMDAGNERFLRGLMVGIAILGLICMGVLSGFNTCCLADDILNPYCTGDAERIEALTEGFIGKYGEEDVSIYWDESITIPERIHISSTVPFVSSYPEFPSYWPSSWKSNPSMVEIWATSHRSEYHEKAKEFAFSFLSENSEFLGIDIDDVEFSRAELGSQNSYAQVFYKQFYKGIPVNEGGLHIHVDSEENARGRFGMIMNSSRYYPCIDVDVVPTISKEEAESVILEDRGVSELFNTVRLPVGVNSILYECVSHLNDTTSGEVIIPAFTKLVIYPKHKGDSAYLCWKLIFNLGKDGYYWNYYIDAHTGEIIYNVLSQPYLSDSSGETGSDDSKNDKPSQNPGISNYYPFGLIISPLYQTVPWIVSPLSYYYGLSYGNTSLTLPWAQSSAYALAREASGRNIHTLNSQFGPLSNYGWQALRSGSYPYYAPPWTWNQTFDQILSGLRSLPSYGWDTASNNIILPSMQ